MSYGSKEIHRRRRMEENFPEVEPEEVEEVDTIRKRALHVFRAELERKLKNLQDGEALQVRFRIDIFTTDGKVRGGSDSQRNMPAYRRWRDAVYTRDGYTCQECGQRGGKLTAHHVKSWRSFPEERFSVENGLTLCDPCHEKKHPHLNFSKGRNATANETDPADTGEHCRGPEGR